MLTEHREPQGDNVLHTEEPSLSLCVFVCVIVRVLPGTLCKIEDFVLKVSVAS